MESMQSFSNPMTSDALTEGVGSDSDVRRRAVTREDIEAAKAAIDSADTESVRAAFDLSLASASGHKALCPVSQILPQK